LPPAAAARCRAKVARKVKASVSLSEDLLRAVDASAGRSGRSTWIEHFVRASVPRATKHQRDHDELDLLNTNAAALNRESADVLAYQAPTRRQRAWSAQSQA
jgi:metal-responsive CopG/Arc/MetJ family transcriptional regulator